MGTGTQPGGLPPSQGKTCHQCGRPNPSAQSFCGFCGEPLALDDYISKRVSENLASAIRDRDVLETESSIRVFERALSWAKAVGTVAAVLLAIVGGVVGWKALDVWHTLNNAKNAVVQTSDSAQQQIQDSSKSSLAHIQSAAAGAQKASLQAAATAKSQSRSISRTASKTREDLADESANFKAEVASAKSQLSAAQALLPGMEKTQNQLNQALKQVKVEQEAFSSSQNFIKQIFSSYRTDFIRIGNSPHTQYAILPPVTAAWTKKKITPVYILLHSAPMTNTVQVQWGALSEPRNSFGVFHNVLVLFWGTPPRDLSSEAFDISYFPDETDHQTFKSLTVRDGRAYGDGVLLPNIPMTLPGPRVNTK